MSSVSGTRVGPDRSPVVVRIDAWVSEHQLEMERCSVRSNAAYSSGLEKTHVDGWIVRDVFANGEVDPLALRRKVGAVLGVVLDCRAQVRSGVL